MAFEIPLALKTMISYGRASIINNKVHTFPGILMQTVNQEDNWMSSGVTTYGGGP